MHQFFAHRRPALLQGGGASPNEGRDCELSRRLTALLLFPRLHAVPGPWLMFLTGLCCLVAIKAMEQGIFGF